MYWCTATVARERDLHAKELAVLLCNRADKHWQCVVYRHVLCCWQDKAHRGAAKWQSLATALCFYKRKLLAKVLQAWAHAVEQQQEGRAAAELQLQGIARQWEVQSAALALRGWQQAAQLQGEHRQLVLQARAAFQERHKLQVSSARDQSCCPARALSVSSHWVCVL